jgi:hypothetical protein
MLPVAAMRLNSPESRLKMFKNFWGYSCFQAQTPYRAFQGRFGVLLEKLRSRWYTEIDFFGVEVFCSGGCYLR